MSIAAKPYVVSQAASVQVVLRGFSPARFTKSARSFGCVVLSSKIVSARKVRGQLMWPSTVLCEDLGMGLSWKI